MKKRDTKYTVRILFGLILFALTLKSHPLLLAADLKAKRVPSNSKVASLAALALWMVRICWAMTESTSRSMRLNSSKQAQAPADARPLKNLPCSRQAKYRMKMLAACGLAQNRFAETSQHAKICTDNDPES